jgi:hypothetical protein
LATDDCGHREAAVIVRPAEGGVVHVITQPDHAALAGRIMQHWTSLATAERRDDILRAVRDHDNGWREADAAPLILPSTGAIADFVAVPAAVRQDVWPRCLLGLADAPWAAALVAHHAISVYDRFRSDDAWTAWFARMEALRDGHLARTSGTIELLARDYVYVRLGDLASLAFCNAWSAPQVLGPWTIRLLDGRSLLVDPNPFPSDVPIEVEGRVLLPGPYASDDALRAAYAAAPAVRVSGLVLGRA